jgi:4-hydroxy-4-methyl-2-oxoglutarate aldolase
VALRRAILDHGGMDFETLRRLFESLDTSACCDADRSIRVLDPAIRPLQPVPLQPAPRLLGFARTVACGGDLLPVVDALVSSQAGEVLVVDAGGAVSAVAGELFATEALRRGLQGMVIDGAVRDTGTLRTIGLTVYARYVSPMAGASQSGSGADGAITCGGALVRPGDVVFGDADGVVVIAPEDVSPLAARAAEIQRLEAEVLSRLRSGTPLRELTNFDEHRDRLLRGEASALRFTLP